MLGTDVFRILARSQEHTVIGIDIQEADITSITALRHYLWNRKFDVIIHCAAYTDVDGCETNQDLAYSINGYGTKNVAQYAQETNAVLLYISTDFVFDGQKKEPYSELDIPNPLSIYGKSKLAGEQFIQQLLTRYYIIRTSWLFGKHGKNFVDTILSKIQSRECLSVVNDQIGTPTYSVDLAEAIQRFIGCELFGIYHISNSGICSWFEVAAEIISIAGLSNKIKVIPITSDELIRPAKRPKYSKLGNFRYEQEIGPPLRVWQEAVKDYICNLNY